MFILNLIQHFYISAAERLLAAQNPLMQAHRPHQLFADAPYIRQNISTTEEVNFMRQGVPPPPPGPLRMPLLPPPPPGLLHPATHMRNGEMAPRLQMPRMPPPPGSRLPVTSGIRLPQPPGVRFPPPPGSILPPFRGNGLPLSPGTRFAPPRPSMPLTVGIRGMPPRPPPSGIPESSDPKNLHQPLSWLPPNGGRSIQLPSNGEKTLRPQQPNGFPPPPPWFRSGGPSIRPPMPPNFRPPMPPGPPPA